MTTSGKTVMTRKGQITVPAAIRKAMGLKEGDLIELEFDEERCEVRLRPADSVVDRTFGAVRLLAQVSDKELRQAVIEQIGRNALEEGR